MSKIIDDIDIFYKGERLLKSDDISFSLQEKGYGFKNCHLSTLHKRNKLPPPFLKFKNHAFYRADLVKQAIDDNF